MVKGCAVAQKTREILIFNVCLHSKTESEVWQPCVAFHRLMRTFSTGDDIVLWGRFVEDLYFSVANCKSHSVTSFIEQVDSSLESGF